jgi:hypothetical protein
MLGLIEVERKMAGKAVCRIEPENPSHAHRRRWLDARISDAGMGWMGEKASPGLVKRRLAVWIPQARS